MRFLTISMAFLLALPAGGCAGYAENVQAMRSSLLSGDKQEALKQANKAMKVKKPDELPEKLKGDAALLVLERGTIKQGLDQFKSSSKDFRAADQNLELLDLQRDTMGNIGKYLFSDDSTVYKAPAYEKLLINTLNMINYLALGDLEGARVEARRLRVMQDYLKNEESKQASLLGLGSYLSGFTFEMSGESEQALRHYDDALVNGAYPSLADPLGRLAGCTAYRSERIEALLGKGEGGEGACRVKPAGKGTILVIAGTGLSPHKVAKRIPIGAAIVIAGALLGAMQTAQAQRFAARGLLTFINFPVLEKTPDRFARVTTRLGQEIVPTEVGLNVTEQVVQAWDSIKGKLMVAAITRMLTRIAASVATEQAVKSAGGNSVGGLLAGLAVQGALTVADTPDTRSWVTLPSLIYLSRLEVPPGQHQVIVTFEGKGGRIQVTQTVTVKEGGFVVVPFSTMR